MNKIRIFEVLTIGVAKIDPKLSCSDHVINIYV